MSDITILIGLLSYTAASAPGSKNFSSNYVSY